MNWNASTMESLRRVFADNFVARDIAEPLVSFDDTAPAADVASLMERRDFDAVGIRREGLVVGYVERKDLAGKTCGESACPFDDAMTVSESSPFADVVLKLVDSARLFVRGMGAVGGIITRGDLEKPPVRMWLFGMITLLEMRTTRLIELKCPGEAWRQYLSEGRLQKAVALLEERQRRNQSPELIDCLQISDKGQIIARNEEIRSLTMFQSRRQVEQTLQMLESLRNNLAHSQDIVSCDWEMIVGLCKDMERTIRGTEAVQKTLESDE
jgi:CBS domain-containing protein